MLKRANQYIPTLMLSEQHRLIRHVLLLLVVLLISINVLWDEPTTLLPDRGPAFIAYFFLLTTLMYVNMYGLVPKVLMKGRSAVYLVLVSVAIFAVLLGIALLQQMEPPAGIRTPAFIGVSSGFFALWLFIMGLTTLQLIKLRMENQAHIAELKEVTMKLELMQLQEQINPHFLFNVLNNANILASEDRNRSSDMLLKLDDLLQYQVRKDQQDCVVLRDDIAFLDDYLALEKTRRDFFRYTIYSEGNMNLRIPPLLFIPFVENAVKHNPSNRSFVELCFKEKNGELCFTCRNPVVSSTDVQAIGGLGLTNVKRRLDLLFGGHYHLQVDRRDDDFEVKLKIKKWTVS